jgi:hypothetical protein
MSYMDEFSTTTATLDQAEEEEILTYTVSDEALETAAGAAPSTTLYPWNGPTVFANACC